MIPEFLSRVVNFVTFDTKKIKQTTQVNLIMFGRITQPRSIEEIAETALLFFNLF